MGQEEPKAGEAMDGAEPVATTSAAERECTQAPCAWPNCGCAPVAQAPKVPTLPVEGGRALFYDSNWEAQNMVPAVATITRVWSQTCVNLDNGKSSVLVYDGRDEVNRPDGYYCVLLSDEEAELFERMATYEEQPPALAARANFTRLSQALELPEVPVGADLFPVEYEPGSIECFKGADRRTMRIVAIGYPSGFAQQEARRAT